LAQAALNGMATETDTREQYVRRRRGRYMAQTLESFENNIEQQLPAEVRRELAGAVQDFKALVRERFNALASDCVELMKLEDEGRVQNMLAQEQRDALHLTGRS
jgi:hypothetical protein